MDTNQHATVLEGDRRNSTSCVSVARVKATEDKVVELHWSLPETSRRQELRGLRLAINSTIIALMPKNSLEMTCIHSTSIKDDIWREFCPKRMKFRSNQTHLSVEITNLPRGSSFIFKLIHQAQAHDLTCHYHDTIILIVLPLASTSMSEQDTIKTKYSTTVGAVVLSSVPLSAISASAHITVTAPISVTPISRMSRGVLNTVGPSNTVVPSTVTIASVNDQNTVGPPTTVDNLSPGVQGISDNPPIRDNGVSLAFIVVSMLVLVALRFIITGLCHRKRIARYLNSLVS